MELSNGSKVFLVLIVLAVGGVLFFLNATSANLAADPDLPSEPVTFEVPLGISRAELADKLEAEGIIRDARSFELFARSDGFYSSLRSGRYEMMTNMSADEVAEVFRAGPPEADQVTFTVEEGLSQVLTLERIAAQFEGISEADLQAVLDARLAAGPGGEGLTLPEGTADPSSIDVDYPFEGFLFPQTYNVRAEADAEAVLQRMVDQLSQELAGVTDDQRASLEERGLTLYDAMVVASLIERETRVDDERAVVASVIYNRLDEGMPLQIDATVLYALGEWKARVLFEDTEVESPYNTYQVQGLPPTPISGFGSASFAAALEPDDTTFRYYVLTPACDGNHVFAETLDEHNANVAEFRAADNCQPQ